jgi:phosphatidylglycerol:prolipoprotein diacylglycerol transferase
MLPFRLPLGWVTLGPMEAGILLGVALAAVLARRRLDPPGVPWGGLLDLALGALIGGAVGARLFHAVPAWIRGPAAALEFAGDSWSSGSGLYGGLAGGALGILLTARWKKWPVLRVLDAASSVAPAAFALGKLGCFMAGCCYGRPCGVPPGVRFGPGSLAYQTQQARGLLPAGSAAALPVHPTQLYELAFGLALFAGLSVLRRRSRRPGETALAFAVLYSAWRFGIEFLRDDPGRHGFGAAGLTDSQIAALVAGGVSLAAWIGRRLRKGGPAASGGTAAP